VQLPDQESEVEVTHGDGFNQGGATDAQQLRRNVELNEACQVYHSDSPVRDVSPTNTPQGRLTVALSSTLASQVWNDKRTYNHAVRLTTSAPGFTSITLRNHPPDKHNRTCRALP
jgi:hypothetical protein